ncbi:nucleoid-associated protein [Rheinheimera hassiensis]|uniref:nucleoid-associated protein n=1 Tax=Rheinheimera hassiensis TaxID=1193627 RepID=UPI001F0520DE|nr:nucleoid-associated protein [Rheinheimera hassiensis]
MLLTNLDIERIVIHQVFQRTSEGLTKDPLQSHDLTKFDTSAMTAFKLRVIDALGESSKAVQMQIYNQDSNGLPSLVDKLVELDDTNFILESYEIAKKLTTAQSKKSIPGGIVVVFTGKYGVSRKKFLAVIKAEVHSAYEKLQDPQTQEISLKFVEEVLLTPSSKLYKTAAFFEKASYATPTTDLNDKWTVLISDYQISQSDGKAAAHYFYSEFLGFCYPETSARTTKAFYENASDFISQLPVNESKKSDLLNALTTYMKTDLSSTISCNDFSSKYFDVNTQDLFNEYMEDAGIPTTAFTKDIEHIASKLKFRKVSFSKNVKISAPSDVFKDYVEIETIPGAPDATGSPTVWTKVIIKDRISNQE